MVNTQPKFDVEFKELAVMSIQRQKYGELVMILDDSTNTSLDKVTYRTLAEVDEDDYTEDNYRRIQLAFMGNPYKVSVVKLDNSSGATFNDTLSKLANYTNYKLVFPEATSSNITAMKNFAKTCRDANNYITVIVANATSPDAQYVINFVSSGNIKANVTGEVEQITPADYVCRIGGALCGLAPSRSLTYFELPEVVEAPIEANTDTAVSQGKLVILYQDGSYKLGRAVNSLVTLTDGVTEAFQKIRIVDIMDMIANDIIATFRLYYVGKYVNNFTNKNRFVGAINSYLSGLAREGLLEEENQNKVAISYDKNKAYLEDKGVDTSDMTYIEILKANTGSRVLLDGVCSPTDTTEDLDLGMYLYQALQAE